MVSILCLATGCRPGSGKRRVVASGTFSALTYNVAGLPQGISKSNPASNTPQIGPKLNRYQLVLAQEDFVYHHLLTSSVQHLYATQPMVATLPFTLAEARSQSTHAVRVSVAWPPSMPRDRRIARKNTLRWCCCTSCANRSRSPRWSAAVS